MSFANLDLAQKKFVAKYTKSGRELAQKAVQKAKEAAATNEALEDQRQFRKELEVVVAEFKQLKTMSFPDKADIEKQVTGMIKSAAEMSKEREHRRAENTLRDARARITAARIGVDAAAAKDIRPADIEVMLATPDGIRQLDSMIDNLTDDVPPRVMKDLLRARFGLGERILQSTSARENSLVDKAKHGAILDTKSPKLKKYWAEIMAEIEAEEAANN